MWWEEAVTEESLIAGRKRKAQKEEAVDPDKFRTLGHFAEPTRLPLQLPGLGQIAVSQGGFVMLMHPTALLPKI